ncbi:MAG: hypothetical protein ACTSPV_14050 [Candidatus Hodarchaeales archaeon]
MNDEQFNILIEKINLLTSVIALISSMPPDLRQKSKKDQIKFIYQFNPKISRDVIAIIVGTTPDTVSVRLSEMRKNGEISD